jgi:hypothetical protein
MRDKMVASNSVQKTVQINLRNVIGNYEDEDEEQNAIIAYLTNQLNTRSATVMHPGDVFVVGLPGDRLEWYIVFKNLSLVTQEEYLQSQHPRSPTVKLDYSDRDFHRVYDPNNEISLLDLEDELIKKYKYDHTINIGDLIEVNLGGDNEQSPIVVYFDVIKWVSNIEPDEARHARWMASDISTDMELEDTSHTRGGMKLRRTKGRRMRTIKKKSLKRNKNKNKHSKKTKTRKRRNKRKRSSRSSR